MKSDPSFGIPLIRAAAATDIATQLRRKGIKPQTVFEQAGIDLNATKDPYQQVRLDHYTQLLELAAEVSHSLDFGLTMGSQQDPATWGAFGYLVLNSPTVGAALENIATFMKPWQSGTHIAFFKYRGAIGIEYSITHPSVHHKNQDAEVSMVYIKNVVDRLCARNITPKAVNFEHHPLPELAIYKDYFGVTPSFEQPVNSITYPINLYTKAVESADLQLFPILRQHLVEMASAIPDNNDLVGSVTHQIRQLLPAQKCSLKNIAGALAMEPKTLQRQLKAQGQVFAQMLEDIRRNQATEYLRESSMPIKEICYLLGFSDASAFNKAFKKWTGKTPGQYRDEA